MMFTGKFMVLFLNDGMWNIGAWDLDGLFFIGINNNDLDLIEVGMYDHLKIDDKVFAWNGDKNSKQIKNKGHFAGLNKINGCTRIYCNGKTSFTSEDGFFEELDNCELYKDEDNK